MHLESLGTKVKPSALDMSVTSPWSSTILSESGMTTRVAVT